MEPTRADIRPPLEAPRAETGMARPRSLQKLGLQGKLILAFMLILSVGLAASCWLFAYQSRLRLEDIMGEQARQLSYALALASKPSLEAGEVDELRQISQNLLKSRNILFVAFLDRNAVPLTLSSRDPDFTWDHLPFLKDRTMALMRVYQESRPVLGNYSVVTAPVLNIASPAMSHPGMNAATSPVTPGVPDSSTRLLGYVSVGISQAGEDAQMRRVNYYVIVLGVAIILFSVPIAYAVIHRIFLPIRQLVAATQRITAGDLRTEVAVHRPDLIGELARSFNDMVLTVRRQQEDLNDANQSLAEANEGLEQKVEERTAQLEVANKRLQTEITEKEDFVRAVSHDLNAPLRNIDGMTAMLLMKHRDKFDADVIHRLERIQKNVKHETDLIGELLELSRIKTRRMKMEEVNLDPLVRDLCGIFESDLRSKSIEIVIDTPLPALNCEKSRMRQVFQNLIDNAIKYMGEGQAEDGQPVKRIHIGCVTSTEEAEFYVRDTGIGIDEEDLGKVFVVFRRGRNTGSTNIAGKGVGLSSVKSIIETYNGTIWVESRIGKGSTFRFTINGRFVSQTNHGTTARQPTPPQPVAA